MTDSLTYADAGVNIEKANRLVESIKEIAKKTIRPGVIGEIGGFGGLFSINTIKLQKPVLVSSTDGVGTKLKLAFMTGIHNTVGIDLVAMSVNDIIVQGAEPLFFLDYFATGELDSGIAENVIKGIAEGCKQAKCALLGGETAEMPGFYRKNEYDLAGFAVGIVDYNKIIDGSGIRMGHKLIGIASSGLHSNGYSLARKICFEVLKLKTESYVPELNKTIGEELLTPTRIYSEMILSFLKKDLPIHGLAHITGGGLSENIIRIIPETCMVRINKGSWEIPPVFHFLQEAGNISEEEMMRTFNNGIGMVAIIPEKSASEIMERLGAVNEKAFIIGDVAERKSSATQIKWM
jgi:phosphoribosylformylglycinamidine cyclo-ligase